MTDAEIDELKRRIVVLRRRLDALRSALSWYADGKNYDNHGGMMDPAILEDEGDRARLVLELDADADAP